MTDTGTFLERLQIEYNDLSKRIAVLSVFMAGPRYHECSGLQKDLMRIQLNAMSTYAEILFQRLNHLKGIG